ncbi:(+)-neomenthol dehydrogenase [Thalictrum thalictroides]|uniref:Short-chain dehydrogenase/reductase n=1 Tax=Thalictrum thalictroides TaxID=46969 RepID=A0A7J6XBS3_THATH|nr:(+)-neomenthol dehydrogenase [Thalictrum thalictroides]
MGRKERAKERRENRLQEIAQLRKIPYTGQQRWWCSETIAVVTGANRGIGFEIARQLAVLGLTVVLTSRDLDKLNEATKPLLEQGLSVVTHQLDILSQDSVQLFTDWICQVYGGLDILVNNAGVNFNLGSDNSIEFAETVINTNYYATKRMTKAMIPLMKCSTYGSRIVNVSSRLGRLNGRRNRLGDTTLREQLADDGTLSEELIDDMIRRFLEEVKHGCCTSDKWPQMFTDYSLSKLAVNAYTRLMVKTHSTRSDGHQIHINCYCPGWVKTAMTGWMGNISAEEGADTGVWLAVLHPSQPVTGKFFAERREISF